MTERSDPARGAIAVTPSDTTLLEQCRALYIGASGDVAVECTEDGTAVTFVAAPVGVLPVSVVRVLSTGTAATDIVALY